MTQILGELGEKGVNEYLEKIAKDLEENPPTDKNNGHNALMNDLSELVKEAYEYEFHDFRNKKYATPKIELRNKLTRISQNVIKGKYDN